MTRFPNPIRDPRVAAHFTRRYSELSSAYSNGHIRWPEFETAVMHLENDSRHYQHMAWPEFEAAVKHFENGAANTIPTPTPND